MTRQGTKALDVACPKCGSLAGAPCVKQDYAAKRSPHSERVIVAAQTTRLANVEARARAAK